MSYREAIDIIARNQDAALSKWKITACRLYEDEGMLPAVKFVKDIEKVSLLAAKRIVEKLAVEFGLTRH